MPFPLYMLALAAFAMGTSEFMLAGLLPNIASDLDVTVATAGLLTPAFALGMTVGAPLMAALARTWPARASLFGFVLVFLTAHAAGAATSDFPLLCATRVIAALANAGFLAVALTTATTLAPPGKQGRALALLLSGTTTATIAGVPAGSVLGTMHGWRATFWALAALCLPAAIGILTGLPAHRNQHKDATDARSPHANGRPLHANGRPLRADGRSLRAELAQLKSPRLLWAMLLGALVNAATFAGFTFLAPVVTGTARLGEVWVPVALMLFGAGSLTGVTVAGRLSDQHPHLVIAVTGPLLLIGWPGLALLAHQPAALLPLVFVQGTLSFALGSTLITRVLHEATAAPTMAGSYATTALNTGAATGPLIAATTLNTPAGTLGPLWVSGLLIAITLPATLPLHTTPTPNHTRTKTPGS